MRQMVIYKTTNLINGKMYIGQDSNNHFDYYGSGKLILKAIKKYGKENFTKEIMAWCYTKEHLNFLEKLYIDIFNTKIPNGYNLTDGGEGMLGYTYSEERNKKISKKLTGHVVSEETRKKLGDGRRGKPQSEKWNRNISISLTGENNPFYGKHHTDEAKKKIGDAFRGKPWTKARRDAQINKNKIKENKEVFHAAFVMDKTVMGE